MTTVASVRNFKNETTCAKCGEALIAPEWSEYISERLMINVWSCPSCCYQFEIEALAPVQESEAYSKAVETFFPSLLVA